MDGDSNSRQSKRSGDLGAQALTSLPLTIEYQERKERVDFHQQASRAPAPLRFQTVDDQLPKLDAPERHAVLSSASKAKNQDYMNAKEPPRTTASNVPLAALRQPFGDEENAQKIHSHQMRYGTNTKSSALPLSTGTESKLSGNYPRMIHPVMNDG
jgi:hypothetical protein